jgi:hypothetical protein
MCSLMGHRRSSYYQYLLFSCTLPDLRTFVPYLHVWGPIASHYVVTTPPNPELVEGINAAVCAELESYASVDAIGTAGTSGSVSISSAPGGRGASLGLVPGSTAPR